MSGLHEKFDEIVAGVPVYGDLDRAIEQADRERRHRYGTVAGLAAAAAVVTMIVGGLALTRDGDNSPQPIGPTPTPTPTVKESAGEPIPAGPSEELAVQVGAHGLRVSGSSVPGRWVLTDTRGDVWVAIRTDQNDATSQWWGTGATAHPMPPSSGGILRGGVVISQDAHWIVWTRPAADVYGINPPRVMEVVDTTTGDVRWSRNADADAVDMGALAVTNDGVVVFGHCLEPVLDSGGWPQCDAARVDVWAPEADAVGTVPAEVSVGDSPFPDTVTSLAPLLQRTGAHNGLLVRSAETARPQYVRVTERGDLDVVATLPRGTVAVTADERFALIAATCRDGFLGCGYAVLPLEGGAQRPITTLLDLLPPENALLFGFLVERDDLLVVRAPGSGDTVARCSLAQARCITIRK